MKKLILLLLFIPLVGFGQDYGNDSDALKLCTAIQTNSFISDSKADNALDRILSVIGASKRFVLQPCDNINNAVATSYKGIRYILYDKDFMDSLDSGDNWSNLFILAHEVGHHINGHSLDILLYAAEAVEPETLANQRKQELEADEFAGFVLAKLGATLEQTSSSINLISSEKDDTYDTHPSKSKRLASISTGYNKATGNETVVYETPQNNAEEYFYRAYEKANQNDHYGAISDYTKGLELDPTLYLAYANRAKSKMHLKDFYGAISDYTKSLKINPDFIDAYYDRGKLKFDLNDMYGAISDSNLAIEIDPDYAKAYINRGAAKTALKDFYGAKSDLDTAIKIGSNLSSFDLSIAYYNRARNNEFMNNFNEALNDFSKAIDIKPDFKSAYTNRGTIKYSLEDFYGAIEDFTKTVELDPKYGMGFNNRGVVKLKLGNKKDACEDAKKAKSLGYNSSGLINKACN